MQDFLFVELAGTLTDGKPFVGFAPSVDGPFIDFHGREIEIKASQIKKYLANTLKLIKDYQDRGMEGLPIDEELHNKGKAAGWITGAELGEIVTSAGKKVPVIQFLAKWTKLGRELIEERIMTNFSPTFSTDDEVVVGGSLTNWPASVDERGIPLFNAIELSQGVHYLQESLDEKSQLFYEAFRERFGPRYSEEIDTWLVEVFDDDGFVIVRQDKDFYRVTFDRDGDDVTYADRDDWVKVKKSWVDAQRFNRDLSDATGGGQPKVATPDETLEAPSGQGDLDMGEKDKGTRQGQPQGDSPAMVQLSQEQLEELVTTRVNAALSELEQTRSDGAQMVDLSQIVEAFGLDTGAAEAKQIEHLDQLAEMIEQQANLKWQQRLGEMQRQNRYAELATRVTGGSPEAPRGIPGDAETIKAELMKLTPDQAKFWGGLLETTVKHGLTDYAELGHGKQVKGATKLPAEYATALEAGDLTLADLRNPVIAPDLGDLEQYDLSAFEESGK